MAVTLTEDSRGPERPVGTDETRDVKKQLITNCGSAEHLSSYMSQALR